MYADDKIEIDHHKSTWVPGIPSDLETYRGEEPKSGDMRDDHFYIDGSWLCKSLREHSSGRMMNSDSVRLGGCESAVTPPRCRSQAQVDRLRLAGRGAIKRHSRRFSEMCGSSACRSSSRLAGWPPD